tara:strand:- start:568 stop:1416 length:849 start_codon:yes stop_codon:yes gene_type:complete
MGYIGVQPKAGFTSGLLDRFTSTTGTTVTLTHDIASENDIIVFVNFVKQDSTNYSVGGTGNKTLTLGGTLVSSDVVEVHYINAVKLTQAPSAGSVGISQLNVSDGSSGQALTTNGSGTLSFSSVASTNGITMADQWRLTTSFTGDAGPIGSNLERNDSTGYGSIGTGMSESSGTFSFPSTGIYKIDFFWQGYRNAADDNQIFGEIFITTDGSSSYTSVAHALYSSNYANQRLTVSTSYFFDVTNTSTHKVRFSISSNSGNNMVFGTSTYNATFMNFIRLGDT